MFVGVGIGDISTNSYHRMRVSTRTIFSRQPKMDAISNRRRTTSLRQKIEKKKEKGVCVCVCENIKIGLRRCGHYILGIENEMAQTSVVQITAMYCHGHFSPKAAKHLHSSRKNTKKKKYEYRQHINYL